MNVVFLFTLDKEPDAGPLPPPPVDEAVILPRIHCPQWADGQAIVGQQRHPCLDRLSLHLVPRRPRGHSRLMAGGGGAAAVADPLQSRDVLEVISAREGRVLAGLPVEEVRGLLGLVPPGGASSCQLRVCNIN